MKHACRYPTLLLALLALLATPRWLRAQSDAKVTKVAVMKFLAPGFDPGVVDNLYSLFVAEVSNIPGYQAVSNDEITAMLGFEQQKAMLGCDDTSCLAEIAGALGVDKVISGKVGKVGSTFVINLVLIDNKSARVEKRVTKTVKGEDDVLIETIAQSAHLLLDSAHKNPELVQAPPAAAKTPPPPAATASTEPQAPAAAQADAETGSTPLVAIGSLAAGGIILVAGAAALGLSFATKNNYNQATNPEDTARFKGQTQGLWLGSAISGGVGVAALAAGAVLLAASE